MIVRIIFNTHEAKESIKYVENLTININVLNPGLLPKYVSSASPVIEVFMHQLHTTEIYVFIA